MIYEQVNVFASPDLRSLRLTCSQIFDPMLLEYPQLDFTAIRVVHSQKLPSSGRRTISIRFVRWVRILNL